MKRIILCIPLCAFSFAASQQLDWDRINSQNAPEIFIKTDPQSKASNSFVVQQGNDNAVQMAINSRTNILIQQAGDQNRIYFNNAFTNKEAQTAIRTEGYNNNIDVTGSNSISDKMKLNVKGDNLTVYMRNY